MDTSSATYHQQEQSVYLLAQLTFIMLCYMYHFQMSWKSDIDYSTLQDTNSSEPKKKKSRMFPWWCVIIAWILTILSTMAATLFTVFYGIQFGDLKTRKWFASTIVSFVTDVTIAQPIKVRKFSNIFEALHDSKLSK